MALRLLALLCLRYADWLCERALTHHACTQGACLGPGGLPGPCEPRFVTSAAMLPAPSLGGSAQQQQQQQDPLAAQPARGHAPVLPPRPAKRRRLAGHPAQSGEQLAPHLAPNMAAGVPSRPRVSHPVPAGIQESGVSEGSVQPARCASHLSSLSCPASRVSWILLHQLRACRCHEHSGASGLRPVVDPGSAGSKAVCLSEHDVFTHREPDHLVASAACSSRLAPVYRKLNLTTAVAPSRVVHICDSDTRSCADIQDEQRQKLETQMRLCSLLGERQRAEWTQRLVQMRPVLDGGVEPEHMQPSCHLRGDVQPAAFAVRVRSVCACAHEPAQAALTSFGQPDSSLCRTLRLMSSSPAVRAVCAA